jgi:hypothetical protein
MFPIISSLLYIFFFLLYGTEVRKAVIKVINVILAVVLPRCHQNPLPSCAFKWRLPLQRSRPLLNCQPLVARKHSNNHPQTGIQEIRTGFLFSLFAVNRLSF